MAFVLVLVVDVRASARDLLAEVHGRFDSDAPGRGLTDYPSPEPLHVPKSYAMILLAELARADKGLAPELEELGEVAGMWLLDNAHAEQERVGWGVPVAWDAYGDGSENPADTIYTISNAIVAHALLDWLERDPSAPRDDIVETLRRMAEPYLAQEMRSPSGLLPYSLLEQDRRYDTFNPAAYLAGEFQRLSHLVDEPFAGRLRAAADETMLALLRHVRMDPEGHWYWTYSVQEDVPNDLPHASYIVHGIRTYLAQGGRLAAEFDWSAVRDHLRMFTVEGDHVRAWPSFETRIDLPARLYDIGMAMFVACTEPALLDLEARFSQTIPIYRTDEGYLKYPVGSDRATHVVNEYEAYLYAGLATCAAAAETGAQANTAPLAVVAEPVELDEPTEVPFVSTSLAGASSRVFLDVEAGTVSLRGPDGGRVDLPDGRLPVAYVKTADADFRVERSLDDGALLVSRLGPAGLAAWTREIMLESGAKPIFRAAGAFDGDLVLVHYDNVANANLVQIVPADASPSVALAAPHRLPSVRDPAGGTYEMIPAIFVITSGALLHVVGGAMHATYDPQAGWNDVVLNRCEKVVEAVATPGGPALLCQTLAGDMEPFRISAPDSLAVPQVGPSREAGIPWALRYDAVRGLTVEHARTASELRRMLAYDIGRSAQGGWLELGIDNVESRIPWSQIYYLNGFLDLLWLAESDPASRALFNPLVRDVRTRLDMEIALLDRMWREGRFETRAFSVDRSPALFGVQTSRLLLLLARYRDEVTDPVPTPAFEDLREAVRTLDEHIEVMAHEGEPPEWLAAGRAHLRWPKGSAFIFDGLNVPYNHQNEWAYAVLRTAGAADDASEAPEEDARDILAFFRERILAAGAFPQDGVWNYWWGTAYEGWEEADGVSVNMPRYDGDKIKAWISFRSIDVMSTLSAVDELEPEERARLVASIADLVRRGLLYPFVLYELDRLGAQLALDERVALRYARVSSPWELQSAVWAIDALAGGRVALSESQVHE